MADTKDRTNRTANADGAGTGNTAAAGNHGEWRIPVFGVRHLSPMGAWHLRRYLDRMRPKVVAIECSSDADYLIPHLTRKTTKPPIAVLAYTDALPVRTFVYPLARYSPEYQAMLWAVENKARVEFIDLPSDVFLGFQDHEIKQWEKARASRSDDSDTAGQAESAETVDTPAAEADPLIPTETSVSAQPEPLPPAGNVPERARTVYERLAVRCGEPDYDTYWERRFEHNRSDESYRRAAYELGVALRDEEDPPRWRAESLVREAYMRRRIQSLLDEGIAAERIVAVVGAFHAPVLNSAHPVMTDEELDSLPRRSAKLTLMPYSYFKLSTQSGYGAGNRAPAYFERMWDALQNDDWDGIPHTYLSDLVRKLRESGTHRSTAEVIEGVRLSRTLSALHDGSAPVLADLHDAAVTAIGHGELSVVAESMASLDVGTAIGELAKGVSRTSIQEDFDRELERLKLEKYRSTVKQELSLDLRENRRAKTEEAAFGDLHRSTFLHRLRILNVGFAELLPTRQESATWAENWSVQWKPECEIAVVEAVLLGETVELAAGYRIKTILDEKPTVAEAAGLIADACLCGLPAAMDAARRRLQELSTETNAHVQIARSAARLGRVIRYGDVRQFDPQPLVPLLADLFVQGSLSLFAAAVGDAQAAKEIAEAMDDLNRVSLEHHEQVDEQLWITQLRKLAEADDRNPVLSGTACSILLERGLIGNDDLAREVSRRLSPGIPADLGAGWFEGLAQRGRYTLLARQPLWESLDAYVGSLDDDQFRRALVFLRRAFGSFGPQDKRHICENLGHHWGLDEDHASEMIEQPLTEQETATLQKLDEFNFDDI